MTWVSGHPFRLTPPIGTPVSVTLSFAPDSARPTYPWIGPEAGCMQLDNVSASMTIGGHTWSGSGINAYTNAFLPGTDCYSNGFTQFHLIGLTPPADRPWDLPIDLMLYYKELLVPGAFPEVPTPVSNPFPAPIHAGALLTNIEPRPVGWGFVAVLDLRAVQQPTPVPEPGTL